MSRELGFKRSVSRGIERLRAYRVWPGLFFLCSISVVICLFSSSLVQAVPSAERPIVVVSIDGSINPATDDFLKSSLKSAEEQNAQLFVLLLNTPGGLLTSMQTMVASLLESKVPTVVYVSPSGGGAISAGVFITLAGHFAVMAPGTTIGAAHPVLGGGQDVKGDMGEKIENFTVSLIKAIAEQRGRNVKWAEQAVRESVAITDRQALDEKVIDFIASDLDKIFEELEGKTVNVSGTPVTLENLAAAPRVHIPMSFKQKVVNILSDPNIAILLGLGAMLGIGIELYHPGSILPGVLGAICLVLSLTAGQILPISYGGLALLLLAAAFFGIELFIPSFGIWGISGIVCLVLGSIYFIDTDMIWSVDGFAVDRVLIGTIAGIVGLILFVVCYLAVKSSSRKVTTGREGLVQKIATVKTVFEHDSLTGMKSGRVEVMGEIWKARVAEQSRLPEQGEKVEVEAVEEGLQLLVKVLRD